MVRSIKINPVINGFICEVGCQVVVFTDKQSMITALSEYYDNPEAVEKRFIERAVNKMMNNPSSPSNPDQCNAIAEAPRPTGGPIEVPRRY